MSREEMIQYLTWNAWAVEDELHEAMREVGWKPWATSDHFNREAFLKEIVDLLHFVGNMLLVAVNTVEGGFIQRDGSIAEEFVDVPGLAEELWALYISKAAVNAERMRRGYDGVSNRCPQCGRELVQQLYHEDDNGFEMKWGCPQHGRVDA